MIFYMGRFKIKPNLLIRESKVDIREKLASLQHEIWSQWMKYLFSFGTFNTDGSWTMPPEKVQRWQRQMHTPYWDLSESEKDKDRNQADKIIKLI